MSFEETKEQIRNEMNSEEKYGPLTAKEMTGFEEGDTCPEEECDQSVHTTEHKRRPKLGVDRHKDAPYAEAICPHHGIVANI